MVDWTQADNVQLILQPLRAFLHLAVGDAYAGIALASLCVLNFYIDRKILVVYYEFIARWAMQTGFITVLLQPGIEVIKEYNVIVNCTPVGMYPHVDECPPLPYEAMDTHTLLYDLIYNPDETLFMKKGKEHGATVKNGLEMLLLQAFASWDFWQEEK